MLIAYVELSSPKGEAARPMPMTAIGTLPSIDTEEEFEVDHHFGDVTSTFSQGKRCSMTMMRP